MTTCNNAICPLSDSCARHEKHTYSEALKLAYAHAKVMWGEHIDKIDEDSNDTRGNICISDFIKGFEAARRKYCTFKTHIFTNVSGRASCEDHLQFPIENNLNEIEDGIVSGINTEQSKEGEYLFLGENGELYTSGNLNDKEDDRDEA